MVLECWRCALFESSMHFVCMCTFFSLSFHMPLSKKEKKIRCLNLVMIIFNVLHFTVSFSATFSNVEWFEEGIDDHWQSMSVEDQDNVIKHFPPCNFLLMPKGKRILFNYHLENWIPCKWMHTHTHTLNEMHRLWRIMRRLMNNVRHYNI